MAAIDFLHWGAPFSGETLRRASMGGTESSVVQLAEALARRGHDVSVFNAIAAPAREFGVKWRPLAEAAGSARGEAGIAVASPKLLARLEFRAPIVWLHNPTNSWKQVKRGNFPQVFGKRPAAVLLGRHHLGSTPFWLPYRDRVIIQHGVQPEFFRAQPAMEAPPPRAIFTSQPYRGLDWLLELWPGVLQKAPGGELHVFAPKAHQASANGTRAPHSGVEFRGSVSRPELVEALAHARVQLIPGHHDETYCLAAAEATAMGVPIVTLGLGALSERVRHGRTGFIAASRDEFIARTVQLMTDDRLWLEMHKACLADPGLATWDRRAAEWEALVLKLLARGGVRAEAQALSETA